MDIHQIQHIAQLIHKYRRNELSQNEKAVLEKWLEESEQNRKEFEYLCSSDFVEEWQNQESAFHVEAAFLRFQNARRKKQKIRLLRYCSSLAASILIVLGSSWYLWEQHKNNATEIPPLSAGTLAARLTLENGEILELQGELQDTLRYNGTQVHLSGTHIEYQGQNSTSEGIYNTLEIPRKGEFKLTLCDGTQVWLNSESKLRYPVSFSSHQRKVYLEGEAYFEVKPDATRPFKVEFGSSQVEVLGTSFNIHSYKNESVSHTTLASGKINVSTAGQQLLLKPGEQAVISSDGKKLEKREVDIQLYTAWKDGRFVFRKQRLEDILQTVERWYDIKIKFAEDSLKDVTFSGNLERYKDFDQIIHMLEMTGEVSFETEGNRITVIRKK